CLRPSWFNGAPKIKIKSQIKSRATATATAMLKPGREAAFPPVGAGLPAMAVYQPIHLSTDTPPSQASHTGICARFDDQVGCQAASLCL
ncbi:hypothetical protein, partial [Pseudomonas sp. VB3]|uniref:hypothetical protein n=1 Tax=Pseudomonas sp. VB3 TaxID=2994641 RepID=UPI0022EC96FE